MLPKATHSPSEADVRFYGDVTLTHKGMQTVRSKRGPLYTYYHFISVMCNESHYSVKEAENNLM
jgi:hypothetical protein